MFLRMVVDQQDWITCGEEMGKKATQVYTKEKLRSALTTAILRGNKVSGGSDLARIAFLILLRTIELMINMRTRTT